MPRRPSSLANIRPHGPPPAMRTVPSGSKVAVWFRRVVLMLPVAVKRPVAGSYNSAVLLPPPAMLNTIVAPLATLALPGNMALFAPSPNWSVPPLTVVLLIATMFFGVVFLGIKGIEYYHKIIEHLVPGPGFEFDPAHASHAEIFFILYFLLTGVHALHLLIGVGLTGVIVAATPVAWALFLRRRLHRSASGGCSRGPCPPWRPASSTWRRWRWSARSSSVISSSRW